MTFLAIDPGSVESGFVEYGRLIVLDGADGGGINFDGYGPVSFGKVPNTRLVSRLRHVGESGEWEPGEPWGFPEVDTLVFEWMQPRGMPTSKQEFETMYWLGRFAEAAVHLPEERITRSMVKAHICNSQRANDKTIRAALIDHYGGLGGKRVAVGVKADKGPLYGISNDMWQALALAVTYSEQKGLE